jgi:hypothetical protein
MQRLALEEPSSLPDQLPVFAEKARPAFLLLLAGLLVTGLVDPSNERYARALLFAAQIASLCWLGAVVLGSVAIRALARDRKIRVLHGLEHATMTVLEEQGLELRKGHTYDGYFVLEVEHDGRWWERSEIVRAAGEDAIRRIIAGETGLAYDPRCGTCRLVAKSLVAFAIAAGGIAALLIDVRFAAVMWTTIALIALATLVSRPLGLWAQRAWTVSTALAAASVTKVTRHVSSDAHVIELVVAIDVVVRDDHGPAEAISPIGG